MNTKPHHQNPNRAWAAGLFGGALLLEGLLRGRYAAVAALAAGCALLITVGVLAIHRRRR